MHPLALRMLDDGDALIEGWAVPFTSPFRGNRDAYGTVFDRDTNFHLDWYDQRPLTYSHGMDGDIGLQAIGVVRSAVLKDEGVWAEAQISARAKYFDRLVSMARSGQLQFSSGSIDYMVRMNQRSGHVDEWPLAELTLTPIPANPAAALSVVDEYTYGDFRSACRSVDLALDDLERFMAEHVDTAHIILSPMRAVWSTADQNDFPDSSFAYVASGDTDSEGKTTPRSNRYLPYKDADGKPDAAHVRNALARLDQTDISSAAKASAKKKLQAAAKDLGIDTATAVDTAEETKRSGPAGDTTAGDEPSTADDPPANRASVGSDPVETERSFEDIRSDIQDLLNPVAGGPYEAQPHYTCVLATYPTFVIVARYCMAEDDCDDNPTYFRIDYTLDAQSEPVLDYTTQQQMEQVYVPVAAARSASGAFAQDATLLCRHAAALGERTKDLIERRSDERRPVSATNRRAITDDAQALRSVADDLLAFLQADHQLAQDLAQAAYWADPVTQARELDLLEIEAFHLDLA